MFFISRGDPGKCDHLGNTALHWSAANGHINCVSFLVSFGVNLWSLDNDYHNAKDVAAINNHEEVIQFLDQVIAKQSALNTKVVQKMKEKAIIDAEKRIKMFHKLQKKAIKRAEKEDKMLERQRKRCDITNDNQNRIDSVHNRPLVRKESRTQTSGSLKFSDIVNSNQTNGTTNKIKILSGVSRKVQMKKQNIDSMSTSGDFKVRDTSADDGIRSVRSLMGIRRDDQILYVPKFDSNSNYETNNVNNRLHMKDVFCEQLEEETLNVGSVSNLNFVSNLKSNFASAKLYRAISEPDFFNNFDKESDESKEPKTEPSESSIFERPGFGSVAFRGRFTSETLFSKHLSDESNGRKGSDKSDNSYADSIGSVGSLAHRNYLGVGQHWEDDEDADDINSKTIPVLLFLCAHGLKEYSTIFRTEKIDLEALMLLNEDDLISLGLPLGPRRKIMKAIDKRKFVLQCPGPMNDTRL